MIDHRAVRLTALSMVLVAGPLRAANDPYCSLPPLMAEPTGIGGTWDTEYLGSWASNQSSVDSIWNGLRMEESDWDEGWGFHDLGNLDLMLPRLMNAGYLVKVVEQYAKHPGHGFWFNVSGVPDQIYNQGRWWSYAAGHGEDEWQPACDPVSNASYGYVPADWRYLLHIPGAYVRTVVARASTVVHETVHDSGIGHIDEDECNPPTISCDPNYGYYNANTLQINYLADAAVALVTEPGSDGQYPLVAINGDVCSYLPRFEGQRQAILGVIESRLDRFKYQSFGPISDIEDRWDLESFDCEQCDTADYTFDPNTCSPLPICNEALNAGNAGVNLNNRIACDAYNNAIATAQGLTPEEVADYKALQMANSMACRSADPQSARDYCEAEKASATIVSQVDDCGWLEDVFLPHISLQKCVEEFCYDEFLSYPGDPQDWIAQDPTRCVDYMCSDESCPNNLDQQLCMKGFLMAQGDPDLYVAQCQWEQCERVMVECLSPMFDTGAWVPGDPLPGDCVDLKDFCEAATHLAIEVWINQEIFLDPGPYRTNREQLRHSNPVKHFDTFMDLMRQAQIDGASQDELEQLAVQFTSRSEFMSAMYNMAPQEFVWMFGNQVFDEVVGTGIRGVQARAIEPSSLNAQGQQALQALQNLMTEQGLDETVLNIGSFSNGP